MSPSVILFSCPQKMLWAGSVLHLWVGIPLIAAATLHVQSPSQQQSPPDSKPVTFNKEIAPIVFEQCSGCHRPGGGAPFRLLTYEDAHQRATLIAAAAKSRDMPPWKPEPGYGKFSGERRLSDREIEIIQQWVEQGALQGDSGDLPPIPSWPSEWQLGKPDLIVTMPEPYLLGSDGPDVFRSFVIPIPIATARHVRALEFRPGGTRAIHHANVKIDRTRSSARLDKQDPKPGFDGGGGWDARFPDGHFLGWTPGQTTHMVKDTAWRLEPESTFVVEMHLRPTGKPELVQASLGLFFTDAPPASVPYMLRLGSQRIDIPAGAKNYVVTDTYVLPVDVEVLSVQPHAHNLAKETKGFARLPDGATEWLIYIKGWDFNWQEVYRYAEPLPLPSGTTLVMEYTYDNSADNARNPNRPPRRVTFGQTSSSEMGDLWLQVITRTSADRAVLDRNYAPKMLREDIAGAEKMLELDPTNAKIHTDLAFSYLAESRVAEAIAHLEESVRLEPDSANAHYDLATTLLEQERLDEAGRHFTRAADLDPNFSEAHNNLGVVYYVQGRIDEAVRSYSAAVDAKADNAEALYNLGRALAAQQKPEQAIVQYRKALEIKPDSALTRASLASLLTTRGQVDEAILHYRRALQLSPDLLAALVDLAWILATSDRPDVRVPDEAIRLAERAAELTGYQHATVLDTLAAAYFSANQLDRALSTQRAALERALATGTEELVTQIRRRLEFYTQRR